MALPFDLPAVSRGFAELGNAAREKGAEIAAAASRSLGALLGREVVVRSRAVPGGDLARSPAARLGIDLPALPAFATLEVEPALVVRLVDALAGGSGETPGATALTPIEAAALELLALAALDGACSVPGVEEALSPRLTRSPPEPRSPLAIELDVAAGTFSGRARLLVAPAAVRALGAGSPVDRGCAIPLPASLRRGTAPLEAEELAALAPGDVVRFDAPADGRDVLVLAGALRACGRAEGDAFHVEEIAMAERRSELPVTLEIELARFDVPLAEIARLEPGAILSLPVDRRGLVALRVCDRAIARGELVDVDGGIGVRVLSIEVVP